MFFNGPVQNGLFTLEARPGKAVGIRLAAALNAIVGAPVAPHLWNTVTLAGDRRHRETSGNPLTREAFESNLIASKYTDGQPESGVMTDTADEVTALALEMIESNLRAGAVVIRREALPTCRACGHMTGATCYPCRACGSADITDRVGLHLVAELTKNRPVLDREDIHASNRRQPKHLQKNAANTSGPLILSRTRDHGIDLAPVGLPGLVLDPRVGLHVTVLAAACRLKADSAVMTLTPNAANHIAAHGQHFRAHGGTRLQYALHGHIPYDAIEVVQDVAKAHTADLRTAFEAWFLPVLSLSAKSGISAGQLPALFRHFLRAWRAQSVESSRADLEDVRSDVIQGDADWVMSRPKLAAALATAWQSQ